MESPKAKDTDYINQKADVLGVAIVAMSLVVPTIFARVYVRTRIILYFGIDDILMILSGISVVAAASYSIVTVTDLQVAVKKKVEIMAIFSLGLLACGASIARLFTIHNFYGTEDKTWAIVPIMTCSFLELALAIVAACLPTLKPGFVKLSNWAKRQPFWAKTAEICSRVPTLNGRRRSTGSSIEDRRRSSVFGANGKANTEPGMESPAPRRLSTVRSMVEWEKRPNSRNKEPSLSEIGRWGLKNNDFCRDLEMQHDLPPTIPERPPGRSLSEHYLGSGL
ncbi:hypothetical protein TWF730_007420 [Orbilia blumenaviensis]|uniref:Rhodopsin domain-containing protein n=1 Tax=Orbilia blumenaviensis TaxID=1796055 RepID=A0AAV9V7T2_9PEZI